MASLLESNVTTSRSPIMMSSTAPRLSHNDYIIACICPMGVKLAATEVMLDEIH
jgi:hypothetical protein